MAPASQVAEAPHSLMSSAPAPVPQTTLTATEHLQAAVRHLREAGFPEDADRIQRQLDEMLEIRLIELSEKRKQLETLQASIAEMEQQLGVASQYHLDCMLGELGPASGSGATPAAAEGTRKNLFKLTSGTGDMKAVLQAHLKNGTARVLAHSHLVARAGEPVAYLSGGELPAVVPAAGASLKVAYRPYGEQVVATITPLGGNRVRVDLRAELSELDHQVGVRVAGAKVPGVRSRSICSEFEMTVGETQMLVAPDSANGKSGFFAAITVRPLHPLGAAADAESSHAVEQTR
jgi:Flp pilus assembly secretin CpaC